ncbi:type I restriction endonuclease subunit R [Helicobacter turcicus]|uniref:Type I restriction enzyme endonuclease subunit n=1 Tax=Helicobacter turcicus TaxID=2867412 RepID=A0ABS7JQ57_9HELI|nr:type I restriction endonuclease subunit R [Helicobacter turcicus]MBX7491541.1 type I restriction endonuclease subunit R [Helicobacter turcicus]MBX7546397.1 type I restriction endonuclease subunit R [Helicobacter turcicus]
MKNDLIAQNQNSTIIAQYHFTPRVSKSYQSEADLERFLLKELEAQGYERLTLKNTEELENNLKAQLERLNNIQFSQSEWEGFYKEHIANENLKVEDKTRLLQTDNESLPFCNDKGEHKNILLLNKKDPLKNHLQVLSQLSNDSGKAKNRYDVTILVNGLPLVHIELKKRGIDLKEAFNQIRRYQEESFSASHALFEFVQIFIISNGTYSKYYSNSKRDFKSLNDNYTFCISFSDSKNNKIEDLEDFTKTFLAQRTLLSILTKYCVFNTDKELLIMRPYQICASEKIIDKIKMAHSCKLYGSIQGGGYIWHSTGSGKTLTSFKTALLATQLDFIYKVLFVVDRKDLDHQTQKEYDKLEKGAANSTNDTKELKRRLESEDGKILITTIQKLSNFIKKYENSKVFNEEIVFIFDECHRSQFGAMHEAIIKKFKKYYIFGFTGTPIFTENAGKNYTTDLESKKLMLKTTQSTFGDCLHSYTILNAIKDKNVLPFKVSYLSTMQQKDQENKEEKVSRIDTEEALMHEDRIKKIVSYILETFNRHTKRQNAYTLENQRKQGFNAMFATASVDFAKKYYAEFQRQIKANPQKEPLKIGLIYSYEQNEDLDEPCKDEMSAKAFLSEAIKDYSRCFKESFSLEKFDNYYKNISQKVKDKELDLLIVVNMFLTGFDSKTLNTLYVDKNLKHHSLLQAFSRTNRILNEQKVYGNVVCFRDLEKDTNESLAMFGDENASSIVLLESFEVYFKDYCQKCEELLEHFKLENIAHLTKEEQKAFIKLFNEILKLENILSVFDEFTEERDPLPKRAKQDYQSHYLELYRDFKQTQEKESIAEDLSFEIELIKQNDIHADYIIFLLEAYRPNTESESKKENILKLVQSSPSLRDKTELIEEFLNTIDNNKNVDFKSSFIAYIKEKSQQELDSIIKEENLNADETKDYLQDAFEINFFKDQGKKIQDLLPNTNIFTKGSYAKRQEAIAKLKAFFEKFQAFLKKEEM